MTRNVPGKGIAQIEVEQKSGHEAESTNSDIELGLDRRTFITTAGGSIAGAAVALALKPQQAHAGDLLPNVADPTGLCETGPDYSKIPQLLHKYPSSARAQQVVQ